MTSSAPGAPVGPRGLVRPIGEAPIRPTFSICTLVTRWEEYEGFLQSFRGHGFDESCCEYLVIDNSRDNAADAYIGLNEFLQSARGDYVLLCHQDIVLCDHGRRQLEAMLDEMNAVDPTWGVCGNAGRSQDARPVLCLSHPPKVHDVEGGPFPARVVSLDENFLVVRRVANLALSRDLSGFHHYGPDLCVIADVLGWSCYVIGFYLRHNSGGTVDDGYARSSRAIAAKYRRAFRARWVHLVTAQAFFVSGNAASLFLARSVRKARWLTRGLPGREDLRAFLGHAKPDRDSRE